MFQREVQRYLKQMVFLSFYFDLEDYVPVHDLMENVSNALIAEVPSINFLGY